MGMQVSCGVDTKMSKETVETDKRLVEAADAADVLETGTDAMREPDSIRNTSRPGMALGKYPEGLLAHCR
jgi:hypothetical protein